ncbi:hypothetical protein BpHYR1_027282 [Brachionus plicatilis]|uniref:Uncharacterized protein n=1 Tax=Brachionus plicatilis TaxID=10195 RepID=A0A3M7RAX3_BRAPC|nr:hypothetical protein BpHYR1_027282 [Brachionus plicatilis]
MLNLLWIDFDLQTECKKLKTRDLNFEFKFSAPKKQLKNVYNYDFKPEILIADEAKAIATGFLQNANNLNNGNALIKKIDKSKSSLMNLDYINSRYNKLEWDKKFNFDKLPLKIIQKTFALTAKAK